MKDNQHLVAHTINVEGRNCEHEVDTFGSFPHLNSDHLLFVGLYILAGN